jgi:hypothetical protein
VYAKIYASMWDGTLGQQWEAWTTFVYLLANCDKEGFIDKTPEAISASSGLPLTVVLTGLKILEEPDHRSRRAEQNGCRLERIDDHRDWGWRIVNYTHYRTLIDEDLRRHQLREAQKRRRQKLAAQRPSSSVIKNHHASTQAEAEAEAVIVTANAVTPSADADDISPDIWFEDVFWPAYPKKCRKPEALKELHSLLRSTPKSRHDQLGTDIMAGLRRYLPLWTDRQFIPDPNRFLKHRRWEDELEEGT